MFDHVVIECDLPQPVPKYQEWQTKDFKRPFLEIYRITKEKRLLHEVCHYEDHSDKTKVGLASLVGSMSKIHDGWEDMNFHGVLNFHTYTEDKKYYSCEALFDKGACIDIKVKVEE